MRVHRIRLAGPWELRVPDASRSDSTPERQVCQLPFLLSISDKRNQSASLYRRFHCPTGIEKSSVIRIALEVLSGVVELKLNDQSISELQSVRQVQSAETLQTVFRFDVSALLRSFNEIHVCLTPGDESGNTTLLAASLEIHEP